LAENHDVTWSCYIRGLFLLHCMKNELGKLMGSFCGLCFRPECSQTISENPRHYLDFIHVYFSM